MYQKLIEAKAGEFEKALSHLTKELNAVRTGRASPALVENLLVESYGTKTPLKNVASITVPDARSLAIQPWDRSLLSAVEKAIQASSVGIQPVNDGAYIRLNMPPLNEERRKELVRVIKGHAEAARVRLRNVREEIWKEVGRALKEKQLTEDDKYKAEKDLKKTLDGYNEKIEEMSKRKEAEIMTV
ncbi:MAG: ribosome recycling factor [Patescibacteria group bacterium]|nr:ribosome recycling factor [Patescibacteria group bacterium]